MTFKWIISLVSSLIIVLTSIKELNPSTSPTPTNEHPLCVKVSNLRRGLLSNTLVPLILLCYASALGDSYVCKKKHIAGSSLLIRIELSESMTAASKQTIQGINVTEFIGVKKCKYEIIRTRNVPYPENT